MRILVSHAPNQEWMHLVMSYHIVHLLSRDLQVNLHQLQITKKKDGFDITVVVSGQFPAYGAWRS